MVEAPPDLPKVRSAAGNSSASRVENKTKTEVFVFYAELALSLQSRYEESMDILAADRRCGLAARGLCQHRVARGRSP